MPITAIVDHKIRLPAEELDASLLAMIEEATTIPNVEKEEAAKRHVAGWQDMDDTIEFWEYMDDHLIVPRGYGNQIHEGCEAFGVDLEWDDQRTRKKLTYSEKAISLRNYQERLVEELLACEQGIAVAPTGAGKTVAALELIRRLGGNALVIVNTKEIAQQWMDRVDQWLGEDYPVSLIGDGEFEISDGITIAIQASLWSRGEDLWEDGFFERFQIVCLDECHHATARTYRYVLDSFSAAVRFGMSATPKKTGDFELAQAILGDIIVEITDDEVGESTMKPSVDVVQTAFGAVYKGDRMTDRGFRRNNYSTILKKLANDERRNDLIANIITYRCPDDCAHLVLSKRLGHLDNIKKALLKRGYPEDRIFYLTGKQSREERKEVVAQTDKGYCVVLSTLADEALDAPRLDRLHLTFPTANPDLLIQQIGRIRRRHPDKLDAVVIDYWDRQVGPFNKNYLTRRHEVYDVKGFKVYKRKW